MTTFWGQVWEQLFPKANRVIATVAGVRTFFQGLTGAAFVTAGGGISLTAAGIAEINWTTTTYAVIAVVASAIISGLAAFGNIIRNGLPASYTNAVVKSITDTRISTIDDNLKTAVTDAAAAIKKEDN